MLLHGITSGDVPTKLILPREFWFKGRQLLNVTEY